MNRCPYKRTIQRGRIKDGHLRAFGIVIPDILLAFERTGVLEGC